MRSMKLNLKHSGVYEWLLVRISAVAMILYIIYLCNFIWSEHSFSYEKWCIFFYSNKTKTFNITILLLVLKHTWIGMRHIIEDYIQSITLRRLGIGLICIILCMYLLLGIIIIWGI